MQVYLDGTKTYQVNAAKLDTYVGMSSGAHRLTVQGYDAAGAVFKSTEYITVP